MNKKVSIIVPLYNAEKYIQKCVYSLTNQSYKNIEIILINDGSTDQTKEVISKVKKSCKFDIRVFNQKNKGPSAARNKGIKNVTGDYIIFIDADDYIEKNMIEVMVNKIETDNSDLVCCGFDRVDEDTKRIISIEMINKKRNLININTDSYTDLAFISSAPWGKLYKKDILKNIYFDEDVFIGEDLLFLLNVYSKINKVSFVNSVLYHYIVHVSSLINNINLNKSQTMKEKFAELDHGNCKYYEFLCLEAFIHIGISLPHRVANNKNINLNHYFKDTKKFLNKYFQGWKKLPFKLNSYSITKNILLKMAILSYKTNSFIIFIKLYNFMIRIFKIDIKW